MRRKIPTETWEQVKTAFAAGVGLREIARNMNIPEGTVLARAKREGWTREIQNAKALAKREDASPTVTPVEAVATVLADHTRATRAHIARIALASVQNVKRVRVKTPRELKDVAQTTETVDPQRDGAAGVITFNVLNVHGDMHQGRT
jgi:restriction endonuclease Mrr